MTHLLTWLRGQALELGAEPVDLTRTMVVLIDGAIVAAHASRDATMAQAARLLAEEHLTLARRERL